MFSPGKIIKRASIHDQYGGSRRGGIASCKNHPFIFIFSGKTGTQYGYEDEWLTPSVFQYTGAGQYGDMELVRGNLALRNHVKDGKRVFLFEIGAKSFVKFLCEVTVFDIGIFKGIDKNGDIRQAIKFFFHKVGEEVSYINDEQYLFDGESVNLREPTRTERRGLVTSRVGQGAYRKSIIHRWENKCAVTSYNNEKLLIASHILPWKQATDLQRLDVHNGLLLSPNFDGLFDKKLISFGDEGEILLSTQIKLTPYSKLGLTGNESITGLTDMNLEYLQQHRGLCGF